jgi:hypothetical protein
MSVVKHLLRYVAGTIDIDCSFISVPDVANLIGYSNADMAGDIDDRRARQVLCFSMATVLCLGTEPKAEGGRIVILRV